MDQVKDRPLDLTEALFFPYAIKRRKRVIDENIQFVHYTSAEAGIAIIKSKSIRLRNSSVMNDFSEVQHGIECLKSAYYGEEGRRLNALLDSVHSGTSQRVEEILEALMQHQLESSFLVSIGEHGDNYVDEDRYGRLSMWRAYGGDINVAFVFNNKPFTTPSDALGAYTSPVFYADADAFNVEFRSFISNFEANAAIIKNIPQDSVIDHLLNAMHFAVLSTKHPGFSEEREWRVIHSPTIWHSEVLKPSIEIIGGLPQRVFSLPMANIPEKNFTGAEIPELLDRVIIGPTQYPRPVAEAFIETLGDAGVPNAKDRVFVSDIPLRR